MVYRPTGDIDFGPKRTHRVWSGGRYAELPDEEWERMGWSITVRQANPTNRVLTRLRAARTNPDGSVNTANITMSEVWMDGATPQELAHALHVLARMELLRQLPARTTDQGGGR